MSDEEKAGNEKHESASIHVDTTEKKSPNPTTRAALYVLGEGRVYGGGLHKLEPKELANVPMPEVANLLAHFDRPAMQPELFEVAK